MPRDSDVFTIVVNPDAEWDHSRFPHPLITIDYDRDDRPIQVCAVGSIARRLTAVIEELLRHA